MLHSVFGSVTLNGCATWQEKNSVPTREGLKMSKTLLRVQYLRCIKVLLRIAFANSRIETISGKSSR